MNLHTALISAVAFVQLASTGTEWLHSHLLLSLAKISQRRRSCTYAFDSAQGRLSTKSAKSRAPTGDPRESQRLCPPSLRCKLSLSPDYAALARDSCSLIGSLRNFLNATTVRTMNSTSTAIWVIAKGGSFWVGAIVLSAGTFSNDCTTRTKTFKYTPWMQRSHRSYAMTGAGGSASQPQSPAQRARSLRA